jgi:hypothetical protein
MSDILSVAPAYSNVLRIELIVRHHRMLRGARYEFFMMPINSGGSQGCSKKMRPMIGPETRAASAVIRGPITLRLRASVRDFHLQRADTGNLLAFQNV